MCLTCHCFLFPNIIENESTSDSNTSSSQSKININNHVGGSLAQNSSSKLSLRINTPSNYVYVLKNTQSGDAQINLSELNLNQQNGPGTSRNFDEVILFLKKLIIQLKTKQYLN